MTRIRLDAVTLAKFQSAGNMALLCDEAGNPVTWCNLRPFPDHEPDLSPDEWKQRLAEPGGMTTAEIVEHLQKLGSS
jgi:hypothetical protein